MRNPETENSIVKQCLSLLLAFSILAPYSFAQDTSVPQTLPSQVQQVSVQDVVAMKQAGLSDDIVIAKIQQHNVPSELSTTDLIGLKKEKVSDAVIRTLIDPASQSSSSSTSPTTLAVQSPALARLSNINPSGATPEAGQAAVGDPNDPLTPHDSGIYLYTKDHSGNPKMVMLERTAYQGAKTGGIFTSAMTYGVAKMKIKAVIPGKKADLRVESSKLIFYFYFDDKAAGLGRGGFGGSNVSNPNQFALLRLNVEKNARTTEIGQFSMWGGSSGSNEKSMIPFKSERIGPGLYKVEVASDLKGGEYCFVASSGTVGAYGAGATTARDLFDFGIDTM
jgi:hypothetical protein